MTILFKKIPLPCFFTLLLALAACTFPPVPAPLPTAAGSPAAIPPTPTADPAAQPTPALPLPTPPPTAAPQPAPTYDPALADWTVFIYGRDGSLEAAGDAERIHVLAYDGPEGDAAALVEFLSHGISNYPANRYALLWCEAGLAGETNSLTHPDVAALLARELGPAGRRFDLIAFIGLTGRLDVLQAVQPYAYYAVALAGLAPLPGWDQVLLSVLYANPGINGRDLAQQIVTVYEAQSQLDDFATAVAADLAHLPDLVHAVETLSTTLAADPAFVAGAVAQARRSAVAAAPAGAGQFLDYAAVDLRHFASTLARRSPDELVANAAVRILPALAEVVVAQAQGYGITVPWPHLPDFAAPADDQALRLPAWETFRRSYDSAGLAELPPQLALTQVLNEVTGVQRPAYLAFEMAGQSIERVALLGGRYEEDGAGTAGRRLLVYDLRLPEPAPLPDGDYLLGWRDGVHDGFFVWDTAAAFLYDAAGAGDFVVLWPVVPIGDETPRLLAAPGRYRPAGSEQYVEASLLFDHGRLLSIWTAPVGSVGPLALLPEPGDEFQIYDLYLDGNGALGRRPGVSLSFAEDRQLYYEQRPLPDGRYFLGVRAENAAGATADALADFTLDNSSAWPGFRAYLDPYHGFRFLYPETWRAPVYTETVLHTGSLDSVTQAQVAIYPVGPRADARGLQTQTLAQFGDVDVLFTEEIIIAGLRGLRTAYGYDRTGENPRTGIFLTFVKDGVAYVVDVDGPQTAEAGTIAAVDALIAGWEFTPALVEPAPGRWTRRDLDGFSLAQPADFTHQAVNNWQRFSAGRQTFLALRLQPTEQETARSLAMLLRDAGAGVAGFTAGASFRQALAGAAWQRADFTYTTGDGEAIAGFIMVRQVEGQEVIAWAEAPQTIAHDVEQDVFLIMIADMRLRE